MFLNQFTIATMSAICNRGKKKFTVSNTDSWITVFDDEMKLCALLNAIGREGLQVLLAKVIDVSSAELTFDHVLKAPKKNYEREQSLNVKIWNFNSAHQKTGKDP